MNGPGTTVVRCQMNITIRLTKIQYEMLKELQKKDKRYKKGLERKVLDDIKYDYPRGSQIKP
jgi:hypothetical protein